MSKSLWRSYKWIKNAIGRHKGQIESRSATDAATATFLKRGWIEEVTSDSFGPDDDGIQNLDQGMAIEPEAAETREVEQPPQTREVKKKRTKRK